MRKNRKEKKTYVLAKKRKKEGISEKRTERTKDIRSDRATTLI